MLLTGAKKTAAQAKRLRLVDAVADPAALEHAAILAARQLASGQLKAPVRGPSGLAGYFFLIIFIIFDNFQKCFSTKIH